MQKTLQGFWFKTKISSSMTSAGVARPSHGLLWHLDFTFVKCNQNLYEYRVDIVNVISINTIWPRATDSWFDSCWMQFLTQCWDWQPDIRSSVHLCPSCHASIFWANQKVSSPTIDQWEASWQGAQCVTCYQVIIWLAPHHSPSLDMILDNFIAAYLNHCHGCWWPGHTSLCPPTSGVNWTVTEFFLHLPLLADSRFYSYFHGLIFTIIN